MLTIIQFVLINLAFLFVSLTVCLLLGVKKGLIFFISVFVVFISLITVELTGLGIFGMMTTKYYFIVSLLVLGAGLVALKYTSTDFLALFSVIKKSVFSLGWSTISIFVIAFALIFFWGLRMAAFPVWDYDSIAYHLPFVANFIQAGSINDVYFSAISGPLGYYPSGVELLFSHWLLFFKADSVLNSLNLALSLFLFLAIYLVAKELDIPKKILFPTALVYLTMPMYLRQLTTLKIDIFFTLLFVCLTLYLVRIIKDKGNYANLVLFALSGGIFLGSRFLAIPYLILPLIIFAIFFLFSVKKIGYKKVFLVFCAFFILFSAVGGFWYARNWYLTGNPIFPTEVSFLGRQIFSGLGGVFSQNLTRTSILSNSSDFRNVLRAGKYYLMETVSVPVLAAAFAVILVILNVIYRKSRQFKAIFMISLLFLFGAVLYFYFYLIAPNSFLHLLQNVRYSMPALFLGTVVFMFAASLIKNKFAVASFIAIFCMAVGVNFYSLFYFKQPEAILGLPVAQMGDRDIFYDKLARFYGGLSPVIKSMEWADHNVPLGAKIGYSGFHFHYPLFGRDLGRQVDYITVNRCFNCNYFDYKNSEGNIFVNPDYDAWLANIDFYRSQYYVYYGQGGYPESEGQWLKDHPEIFQPVYSGGGAFIYEIKRN